MSSDTSQSDNVNGTDSTVSKPTKHWLFKPGDQANPYGRLKGSRNRLAERLISDFCTHWEKHGAEAIDWLFKNITLGPI
jgi:hypothetical protein